MSQSTCWEVLFVLLDGKNVNLMFWQSGACAACSNIIMYQGKKNGEIETENDDTLLTDQTHKQYVNM